MAMGRFVHMGCLPTVCRLADVGIHPRQSAKRCETQRRHTAAPSSRERSAQLEVPLKLACLQALPSCRRMVRRAEPVPHPAWDS
eukprot:364615-Chlamydomonas_euryale.AAC.42